MERRATTSHPRGCLACRLLVLLISRSPPLLSAPSTMCMPVTRLLHLLCARRHHAASEDPPASSLRPTSSPPPPALACYHIFPISSAPGSADLHVLSISVSHAIDSHFPSKEGTITSLDPSDPSTVCSRSVSIPAPSCHTQTLLGSSVVPSIRLRAVSIFVLYHLAHAHVFVHLTSRGRNIPWWSTSLTCSRREGERYLSGGGPSVGGAPMYMSSDSGLCKGEQD